jgi:hypothetical protein
MEGKKLSADTSIKLTVKIIRNSRKLLFLLLLMLTPHFKTQNKNLFRIYERERERREETQAAALFQRY